MYAAERGRLIDVLDEVTEGGIVEAIRHVGSTSVPGLYGSPCVDIGLTVWPFPLEAGPRSRLEALGYQVIKGYEEGTEQRFRHHSGSFQLYLMEAGSERWLEQVLIRDYLRHDHAACQDVSLKKRNPLLEKSQLFEALLPAARQWWIGYHQFAPVEAVASELNDVSRGTSQAAGRSTSSSGMSTASITMWMWWCRALHKWSCVIISSAAAGSWSRRSKSGWRSGRLACI
jgi:hypothetical protein